MTNKVVNEVKEITEEFLKAIKEYEDRMGDLYCDAVIEAFKPFEQNFEIGINAIAAGAMFLNQAMKNAR